MNAALLSVGIAIAVALVAAFAAPFFIDWSAYRTYFEARAGEIVGREVSFAGELDVRLVPFPMLVATDVRIGGHLSGEGADVVEIHAALAPLLNGQLQITDMVLRRPFAVVGLDPAGRLVWSRDDAPDVPLSPEQVRVDRLEVIDGAFAVDDARTGGTYQLSEVNVIGSAASLYGPFKADGGLVADGRRMTVRLATGRMQQETAGIRVKLSVQPADRPVAIEIDGTLVRNDEVPTYSGTVAVERIATEGGGTPWRFEGITEATPEQIVVDKVGLRLGPETQAVTLAGAVNVELGATPGFDAVLSARQVDLDRMTGQGSETASDPGAANSTANPTAANPVAASPAAVFRAITAELDESGFAIPGRLALDIDSMVLGGGLLEALSMDMLFAGNRWAIERATIAAPGGTDVSLAGTIAFEGDQPAFDGAVRVSSAQPTVFADWLVGPAVRIPGLGVPGAHFTGAARLRLDGEGIQVDDIDMGTADSDATGSFAYRPPAPERRGLISLAMTTDAIELPSAEGPAGVDRKHFLATLATMLQGADLELELRAGSLTAGAVAARGAALSATVSDGAGGLGRLVLGDVGGARIEGAGEIRDFVGSPDGTLTLDVSAEALEGVADFVSGLGFEAAGRALAARAAVLVPARLEADVSAASAGDTSRIDLTIAGSAGGSEVRAALSYDGAIGQFHMAEVDVDVEATNPDGGLLARQLGLVDGVLSERSGRVAFTAAGRPDAGLRFEASAAGIGMDGSANGRLRLPRGGGREISAEVDLSVDRPGEFLGAAGIVLAAPPEEALTLSGTLSATDDIWSVSGLELRAGTAAVSGRIGIDAGGAETVVDGNLEASLVDLPWLVGTLVGEDTVLPAPSGSGYAEWPSTAFGHLQRPLLRGRIAVRTPIVRIFDGVSVRDAELGFGFGADRFSVDGLTGNLFGGRFGADLDVNEAAGSLAVSGRFSLDGARLEEVIWRDGARPVATGELSVGAEFNGTGRSALAVVSSLTGTGSFRISDGTIRRLNPTAFDQIVSAADAGLELTEDRVREVFAGHLDAGSLSFDQMEGAFSVTSGVLRASNIRIDTDDIGSFASATIDLGELAIDSEWTLSVADGAEQSRVREVGVVFAGPLAGPDRLIDVNPLLGYLTVRAFEQEVERLEALQAEILERQRLGRELIRLGQERQQREREAIEREAEEAEAERLRAEEEERRRNEPAPDNVPTPDSVVPAPDAPGDAEPDAAPEPDASPDAAPGATPEESPDPDTPEQLEEPRSGGLDDSEFRRRIEDILRDIPAESVPPPALAPPVEIAPRTVAPQPPASIPQQTVPQRSLPQPPAPVPGGQESDSLPVLPGTTGSSSRVFR